MLAESTCDQTLKVVTASSFAKVLARLQPSLATGPQCIALDTAVVDGRDAAARVAERMADVWIPDDLSWGALARGGLLADDGEAGSGTVLATSPIYMVTDTATAARLTGAGGSWLALSKLVAEPNGVRLAVRDPNGSGDGMVAAGSLGEAVWIKDGMDASSAALSAALRQTRTVPGTAAALPDRPGEVGLVPEYALLSAKRTAGNAAVLAGTDHTAALRYGWLPTAAAVADPARKAGLDRLLAALKSRDADRAYAAAGLRRPDGAGPRARGRAAAAADRPGAAHPAAAPRRPRLRRLVRAGPAQQHPARRRRVRVDGRAGARAPARRSSSWCSRAASRSGRCCRTSRRSACGRSARSSTRRATTGCCCRPRS